MTVFDIFNNDPALFLQYANNSFLYCGQWHLLESENFDFEATYNKSVYDEMKNIINSGKYKLEFFEPNNSVLSRYPIEKSPVLSTDKATIETDERVIRLFLNAQT